MNNPTLNSYGYIAKWIAVAFLVFGIALFGTGAQAADKSIGERRAEARQAARDTLAQLYKVQPSAKAAVESAAGYAAFENFGVKILVAGGGGGKGVAVDNKTRRETFMKMVEIQAGLGVGVKQYAIVFVFETERALRSFVDQGWELSGQASLAAKAGEAGAAYQGAIAVAPGIWMYQITNTGLAAEITAKGTKYYKDDELN